MALKMLITKAEYEELPEAIQAEYVEDEDGFILETDDESWKNKLAEFRSNNIKLQKERKKLQEDMEKYKDIDPEKARAAQAKLQEIEDKELLDAGEMETLVQKRVERMQSELNGKIKKLESTLEERNTELEQERSRLAKVVIDSEVQTEVSKVGTVRQGAMTDVLSRARSIFRLQDGQPVPVDEKGEIVYGTDGKNPLTIAEWATGLTEEAPYLFEGSSGGGSGGNEGKAPAKGTILSTDSAAFGKNLEDIASGKVKVVRGS